GHSRLVVPHLLGHLVLMAIVMHVLGTQFLRLFARGIVVAAGYLPGIAPRSGSIHRPGWILERHAASAHGDRQSRRSHHSSDCPPESVDIHDLFIHWSPLCGELSKGKALASG